MKILEMLFLIGLSLCVDPSEASSQNLGSMSIARILGRYPNSVRYHSSSYLRMYFPSKEYFQPTIEKYRISQQDFLMSCEKIINERDLMIHKPGWDIILNGFDFRTDYQNMSELFKIELQSEYYMLKDVYDLSYSDARMLSIIDSAKEISWNNGVELLRQTYSAEGVPQSLEDAVVLVFLHIKSPQPYSPPLFASLCSRFSESYRSTSEAARLEHDRKEKEDFIFFMKCMANAIAMIEKKDPQELFGYDAVEGATTSFTITDGTTSSKVGSLKSTSLSGTDGSAVVSRRTRSDSEKTLSSVGSISSESESSSSHSEKDSEKEDEKEE